MIATLVSLNCLAQLKPIGDVDAIVEKGTAHIVFTTSGGPVVSVSFISADVIRVRIAPSGKFEPDQSYAFAPDHRLTRINGRINERPNEIELVSSDGVRVVIKRRPFQIEIYDADNRAVLKDDPRRPVLFDAESGEVQTTKLRQSELETYYGFGEKAFLEMSRNGKHIVNWNTDTFSYPVGTDPIYQSIPFFYALYDGKTYGLFLNNTYRTVFDMGKTSTSRYTFGAEGGELDFFVFVGGQGVRRKKCLRITPPLRDAHRFRRSGLWEISSPDGRIFLKKGERDRRGLQK